MLISLRIPHPQEGAALYRLIRSKALELTDVCGYDLELNERRALANATSPGQPPLPFTREPFSPS